MSKGKKTETEIETTENGPVASRRALLGALGLGGLAVAVPGIANAKHGRSKRRLSTDGFDVACNGATFRFSGPADAGGNPAKGANFVVEGVIYESGTLIETDGLTPAGDPEYPDLVIGRWYCKGWFTQDMAAATTGTFVTTTQVYDFGDEPGARTLVSDGIELIDFNVPWKRAITGGSGPFRKARGEAIQEAIGVNATGFFNFRFLMDLA